MSALRYIHPEGLPSDYTITVLFRLLPETPEEPFALWEILNKNNEPLVGVILDSESQKLHTNTVRSLFLVLFIIVMSFMKSIPISVIGIEGFAAQLQGKVCISPFSLT